MKDFAGFKYTKLVWRCFIEQNFNFADSAYVPAMLINTTYDTKSGITSPVMSKLEFEQCKFLMNSPGRLLLSKCKELSLTRSEQIEAIDLKSLSELEFLQVEILQYDTEDQASII